MTLDQLVETIKSSQTEAGVLDLSRIPTESEAVTVLLEGLELQQLPVHDARIGRSADGSGVIVSGTIDFAGGAAHLTAKFRPAGDGVACDIRTRLSSPSGWNPGLPFDLKVTGFRFSSAPSEDFSLTVWAQIEHDSDEPIPLTLEMPGAGDQWLFRGESADVPITASRVASLIGAGDAFQRLFPWSFNGVGLSDFSVAFIPNDRVSVISFAIASVDEFDLVPKVKIGKVLARVMVREPLSDTPAFDLYLAGLIQLGSQPILLEAQRQAVHGDGGSWTFRGTLPDVNLKRLLTELAEGLDFPSFTLPDIVPDLEFEEVAVEITPGQGYFRFSARAAGPWDFPVGGAVLTLSEASFELRREIANGEATYPFTIHVGANYDDGLEPWVPGVRVKALDLTLTHKQAGWEASNGLLVDLFDSKDVHLEADYASDERSSALILSATGLDLDVLTYSKLQAALRVHDITLSIGREVEAGSENGDKTHFDFGAAAQLTVGDKLDLSGRLGLYYETDAAAGVEFSIEAHDKPLAISVPEGLFAANVQPSLSFSEAGIKIASEGQGWYLEGNAKMLLESFPKRIQQALPKAPVEGKIRIDARSFRASIEQLVDPLAISLPALPLSNRQLDDLKVNAYNLAVTIDVGGDVTFSLEPALRLPDDINRALFGAKSDGTERAVFKTGAWFRTDLTVGMVDGSPGAAFGILESPVNGFELEERGDRTYWPCDLGPAGLVHLEMPRLKLEPGGFTAGGGFQEDNARPLTLPLTPLKGLLGEHFDGIGAALPDGLPLLKKPKLFDNGQVLLPQLIDYVEEVGKDYLPGGELPVQLKDALHTVAAAAGGLPDRLKEYLEADLPTGLHFDITAQASGSVTVDLSTEGPPIMALLPTPPMLIGVCLSRLRFGPILGGALFLLRLDAEIDFFDPVTIAGSIAASQDGALEGWLPDAARAHSTLKAHDLVMAIVYQTGVPIPIPIFYGELGVDFSGPAGLELKAGISFNPLAENSFGDVFLTLGDLYEFVSDETKRLPTSGAGIELKAEIGETYLQLPRYLGQHTYGAKDEPLLEVDLYETFATLLNGLKFFSLTEFIRGIPLEHRCGAIQIRFGPLELDAAWAATTRDEFQAGLEWSRSEASHANTLVGLPPEERTEFIGLLPPAPDDRPDQGLILFLSGEAEVAKLFKIGGRFGMFTAGRDGFASGLRLYAGFANRLALEVRGTTAFDFTKSAGEGVGGFQGSGRLLINGRAALTGEVTVSDTEIAFRGSADLFPGLGAITLEGESSASLTAAGFHARGNARISLFGASATEHYTVTHEAFTTTVTATLPSNAEMVLTVKATDLDPTKHGAIAVSGHLENFSVALAAAAAREARTLIHNQLVELVAYINKAYERDKKRRRKDRERYLVTWDAMWVVAKTLALATDGKINKTGEWALDEVLKLLPEQVARGVKYIRASRPLIENLNVDFDTQMSTALQGSATLRVSGKYAGRSFGTLAIGGSLGAADLVAKAARDLARAIL